MAELDGAGAAAGPADEDVVAGFALIEEDGVDVVLKVKETATALIIRAVRDIVSMRAAEAKESNGKTSTDFARKYTIEDGQDAILWLTRPDRGAIPFEACCACIGCENPAEMAKRIIADPEGILERLAHFEHEPDEDGERFQQAGWGNGEYTSAFMHEIADSSDGAWMTLLESIDTPEMPAPSEEVPAEEEIAAGGVSAARAFTY